VCDRDWTCNAATDHWETVGADCVDTRTGTTLHCNGKFDQGGYTNLGTWSGNATQFTMLFPTLGGGTHAVTCTP
jgi:hypothetical protein